MNYINTLLLIIILLCNTGESRMFNSQEDDDDRVTVIERNSRTRTQRPKRALPKYSELNEGNQQSMPESSSYIFPMDSNNVAFVFWKHAKTSVIFILTCQNANTTNYNKLSNKGCNSKSNLYRSENHGKVFNLQNETFIDDHIHSIFLSPVNTSFIILTDYKNQTIYITDNEGASFKKHKLNFSPTFIHFHPTLSNYIAAYDNTLTGEGSLYVSQNAGSSWVLVSKRVRNYYWAQKDYDVDQTFIHLEVGSGKQVDNNIISSLLYSSSAPYNTTTLMWANQLVPHSLYVGKEFIVVQKWADKKLYVCWVRGAFVEIKYDLQSKAHLHHIVLNSEHHELLIGIIHPDLTASLYLSDQTGSKLMLLSDKIMTEIMKQPGLAPKMDFYQVKGLTSTYIINRKEEGTLITFDKGHTWSYPKYVHEKAHGCEGECNLILYIKLDRPYSDYTSPMLSKDSAPGFIIAQGYVGSMSDMNRKFNLRHQIYLSTDGGVTWVHRLDSSYGYALLDHGGLIAATLLKFTVDHNIKFSIDFGATWVSAHLTNLYSRIAAIITESTAKSLIVNVFGFLQDQPIGSSMIGNTWIVWRFNFSKLFPRKCESRDFVTWEHSLKCAQGMKVFSQRRNQSANCVIGTEFDKNVKETPCPCVYDDFQCEDVWNRVNDTKNGYKCVPINEDAINDLSKCREGDSYLKTKGYRKRYGNKCQGGVEETLSPTIARCPVRPPKYISLKAQPTIQTVSTPILFSIEQDEGVHGTTYTWFFNDGGKNIKGAYVDVKEVSRTFYRRGYYNVTILAVNAAGISSASVVIKVLDNIFLDAYIDYEEPLIANKESKFALAYIENDGSIKYVKQVPGVFIWSFGGVLSEVKQTTSASYTFTKPGIYEIEVIIFKIKRQTVGRSVTVYYDAVVFDVRFSSTLDYYNALTVTWMDNFMYKFKMFLSVKYDLHRTDRIIVKGEPKLPTTLRVIIGDIDDPANLVEESAQNIAARITKDINQNKPMVHGYSAHDIHVISASSTRVLKPESSKQSNNKTTKPWVYVLIVLMILFIVAILIGVYQYRRKGSVIFWRKPDGMDKKLFSDVDDDCVTMDGLTDDDSHIL